jgi:RNA polymerase sigma factor (sigma-70 family)
MPLSIQEAEAIWRNRRSKLLAETANYLRNPSLTRPKAKAKVQQIQQHEHTDPIPRELNLSLARAAIAANEPLHEDIVQELGIRFFRRVEARKVWDGAQIVKDRRTGKEREVAFVDCWLSRVHRRVARELARTEARQYLYRCVGSSDGNGGDGAPPAAAAIVASRQPTPEDLVSARERLWALEERLASFPERERRIFLLHHCDYSSREIAADLGITEGAARTSIHRIHMRLRQEARETGHESCSPSPRRPRTESRAIRSKPDSRPSPQSMTQPY